LLPSQDGEQEEEKKERTIKRRGKGEIDGGG